MPNHPQDPRELAARALCELHGDLPDATTNGEPIWVSYLDDVDTVLTAVGFEICTVSGANDNGNRR